MTSNSKFVLIVAVTAVISIGLVVVFSNQLKAPPPQLVGQEFEDDGSKHLVAGDPPHAYITNPPASGPHDPQPAEWGYSDQEIPDEKAIHNLEHGGIWVSYRPGSLNDTEQDELRQLAKQYDQRLIVSPRFKSETKMAVASWRRLEKRDVLDIDLIKQFLTKNVNQSPEKVAR